MEAMNAYVAIIQQQLPAPPAVGPAPPEEQQGQSGLDEESQAGPPPPLSPGSPAASDGSVGNQIAILGAVGTTCTLSCSHLVDSCCVIG